MSDWREWSLQSWNERLLGHFFEKRADGDTGPIYTLLVTSEELAEVTRDSSADPRSVRNAFVDVVLSSVPDGKDMLEHALELPFNPEFPAIKPPFLAHLILTCIAAAESSDDLAIETRYRQRLGELSKGRVHENFLHFISNLWERFVEWLEHAKNRSRYRQLVLPDRGSRTRIGYTEKLAFPDRRDQKELSGLLRDNGLAGQDPLPSKVLSLVAGRRGQFRKSFLDAFDEFRSEFQSADYAGRRRLTSHRFWSAVVEAAMRGRAADETLEKKKRIQLVVFWDGESVDAYFLSETNETHAPQGTAFHALGSPIGPWRFFLVREGGNSARELLREVLAGRIKIPRISTHVAQGIFPLVQRTAEYLEATDSKAELAGVNLAFVRRGLQTAMLTLYGGRILEEGSLCDGWLVMAELRLQPRSSDELEKTLLAKCWMLHDSLPTITIRIAAGIAVDDGLLGYAEVLPEIAAYGASRLTAQEGNGNEFELQSGGVGVWKLPFRDFNGRLTIRAFDDDRLADESTVLFQSAPAIEAYRRPADVHSFYQESIGGVTLLSENASAADQDSQSNLGYRLGQIIFLGPNNGEFVTEELRAAWKVTRVGREYVIARASSELAGALPTFRASEARLRRKWRVIVEQSLIDPSDPEAAANRSKVRSRLSSEPPLVAKSYSAAAAPFDFTPDVSNSVPAVEKLVAVLAARSSARTGVPIGDWWFLLEKFFGLKTYESREALTRCWSETGLVDILVFARWRTPSVFPVLPTLTLYRSGAAYCGYLAGLTLSRTRESVVQAAEAIGIKITLRNSPSKFVPATVVLFSVDLDGLKKVAQAAEIQVRWADVDVENSIGKRVVERGVSPPANYERRGTFSTWSLARASPGGVRLEYWAKDDRPPYWTVLSSDAKTAGWSYDRNTARLHACAMLNLEPFVTKGSHEIVVQHAYLPLPLARYVALLAPSLPGVRDVSAGGFGHSYTFFTSLLRDEVFTKAKTALARSTDSAQQLTEPAHV